MRETDIYKKVREYRRLKGSSFYPFDEKEKDSDHIKAEKQKKRKRIEEIKDDISACTDKVFVGKQKKNVTNAINVLLRFVKKNNAGYSLDRNQGTSTENFVFGKVIGVISSALTMTGVYYPDFYYTVDGDFEELELRELLEGFRTDLQNQEFTDFFGLEECVDDYLKKIRLMWSVENKRKMEVL